LELGVGRGRWRRGDGRIPLSELDVSLYCVKGGRDLTFTFPNRLATEDAGSIDTAAMKLVTKNIVPSLFSDKLNLLWKKKVIQELAQY
jgi:hypothetical protein